MATPATTPYQISRQAIAAEKAQRITAHRANIAARSRMMTTLAVSQKPNLNLLCQGDSWFDYPLPIPSLEQSDVIAHLKRLPSKAPEPLSLAHYGEATEDMLGEAKLQEFLAQLNDQENGKWDAILFSGGGNDLAGNQFRLWVTNAAAAGMNPSQGLTQKRVDAILGVVAAGYEDLFAARDSVDKTIPIFGHSYDFAIPNGTGVCGVGPWLQPGLKDRGWMSLGDERAIVKDLLLQFKAMLDSFASNTANNFIHIQTQGTLADNQWANELHPTPDGFAAITTKFVDALRLRFPGRI